MRNRIVNIILEPLILIKKLKGGKKDDKTKIKTIKDNTLRRS
jgi:hypothetical protein